jgi:single-strand DNA-binding protein
MTKSAPNGTASSLTKSWPKSSAEYARKGTQLYVEGSLRTRKWQDKEGKDRYSTEIVARDIQMLGKSSGDSTAPQKQGPAEGTAAANMARNQAPSEDFNDDVPF